MAIPLNAPGDTPAIGSSYFQTAWSDFFGNVATALNAAAPLAEPTFTGTVTVDALAVTGAATFAEAVDFNGTALFHANIGFFGVGPVGRPTITGSRTGGGAIATLLTQLAAMGLIIDSTVP